MVRELALFPNLLKIDHCKIADCVRTLLNPFEESVGLGFRVMGKRHAARLCPRFLTFPFENRLELLPTSATKDDHPYSRMLSLLIIRSFIPKTYRD